MQADFRGKASWHLGIAPESYFTAEKGWRCVDARGDIETSLANRRMFCFRHYGPLLHICRLISIVAAAICFCSYDKPVRLNIDFSSREQWRYAIKLTVKGAAQHGGRSQSFEARLEGILVGDRSDTISSLLLIHLDSVAITAPYLDSVSLDALRRYIERSRGVFRLSDGEVTLEGFAEPPVLLSGQWNVYREVAKALPALPQEPVSVGSAWERDGSFPVETRHGTVTGHRHQRFVVDSIVEDGRSRLAWVSWTFTYKIDREDADTVSLLDDMPLAGRGRGIATIDITRKLLKTAEVDFEVIPTQGGGPIAAVFRQTARVDLIEGETTVK